MKIFSDPLTTQYDLPGHPERAWRVQKTAERLTAAGYRVERPPVQATVDDALLVHSREHWSALQSVSYIDPDTPPYENIAAIALQSVSGSLSALQSALAGEPAFSLMRPPGHHAGRDRIAGFCYLNNIAIACVKALSTGCRVAVLDIDVHHGDGTEDIALGRPDWLYVSLHQSPLYPGTGLSARQNCLNFPLPPHTGPTEYRRVLEKALAKISDFKPDVLAVSAGFDTYKNCPLAQFELDEDAYRDIGRAIAALKLKRFAALEGGYAPELPVLIDNFLVGFG